VHFCSQVRVLTNASWTMEMENLGGKVNVFRSLSGNEGDTVFTMDIRLTLQESWHIKSFSQMRIRVES
jgi:hypothetical protein